MLALFALLVRAQADDTLPKVSSDADALDVAFGDGIPLTRPGAPVEVLLRSRVQLRASVRTPGVDDLADIAFQVRRARLVLRAKVPDDHLDLYLQFGLGPSDVEGDAPFPLRDWVVTWNRASFASVRLGQMKVPFTRERLISSSALQLVDRSAVNAELNLDRDIGAQVYSNDLVGDGHVTYQLGIYQGEGRNRLNDGTGLLYVGRVQLQPFGGFEGSLTEADLTREDRLRVSFGAAIAHDDRARRTRATHGHLLEGRYDTDHASVDVMLKWRGWSLQAEGASRQVRVDTAPPDGVEEDAPTDAVGAMAQLGHVLASGYEVAGRVAMLTGIPEGLNPHTTLRTGTLAFGRYLHAHDLKLQADATALLPGETLEAALDAPGFEGRVQLQVYF
ncbi:MAG: hypothetical protein H6734_06610 [Alphaproteobacteria bacterium]|nr:hypothetical protein [Alphaproteobacteria bacterium]